MTALRVTSFDPPGKISKNRRRGFTIIELLVVVTILVVLIALLVPGMESAIETARRARCAAHQKAVSNMTTDYTTSNRGVYYITHKRTKPFYLGPAAIQTDPVYNEPDDDLVDWPAALATVGLCEEKKSIQYDVGSGAEIIERKPSKVWTCPNVNFYPPQWLTWDQGFIQFQYFGGLLKWQLRSELRNNLSANPESRSPVRTTTSRPAWALLGDLTGIANYVHPNVMAWWQTNASYGLPPHVDGANGWPAGGNQAYVDHSVEWVPFDKMVVAHSYYVHAYFMYQNDWGDWIPPEAAKAPAWMRTER